MIAFSGQPRLRKRGTAHLRGGFLLGEYDKFVGGQWIKFATEPNQQATDPYLRREITMDETHPGPPYKSGGQFTSLRIDLSPYVLMGLGVFDTLVPVFVSGQGNLRIRYRGGFVNPNFGTSDFSTAQYKDDSFLLGSSNIIPPLDAYYSQVSQKLKPQLSQAHLAQMIGESRDIPSMLKQTSQFFKNTWRGVGGDMNSPFMSPKSASDDYLNLQFGWTPFVSDIVDLTRAVMFTADYIRELTRRNGLWEKRNRVINEVVEDTELANGQGMRCSPTGPASSSFCNFDNGMQGFAWWNIRRRRTAKIWCSGEYKFYMPEFDQNLGDFDSFLSDLRRHLTLYGFRINPSTLWRITPWTWLIDWFANVGSLIEDLENAATDSVVSRNLYLMHREVKEIVLQQSINFKVGARTFEFIRRQTSKQRDHASTPFGFGFSPQGLSVKQLSILAALGISKFL